MEKLNQWVALTVVAVLVVLAAGWFLLVSPKHSDAAALQVQADAQVATNADLATKLAVLKSQAKDLPRQQAKLAAVAAKIPDNAAMPALVRALDDAAAAAGLELVSIMPTAPTAFKGAPAAVVPVAPAGGATVAPVTPAVLQSIAVEIKVAGGFFQVEQFLDRLEGMSRALKVIGFAMVPGINPLKPVVGTGGTGELESGKNLAATIQSLVFTTAPGMSAPTTPVAPAAATPAK